MHVPQLLQQRFMDALSEFTDQADQYAAMIRATSDPKHGDYQANCAMPLAKHLNDGRNPREVASMLVARLELDDLCEPPEIAVRIHQPEAERKFHNHIATDTW